jgi:schlafen family protein
MNREELLARMGHQEDPFVERKTTPHVSDVIAALVAFANSVPPGREAVLFLGVKPDGSPVGVDNADKLQQSVSGWARDQCYPPISVSYEVLTDLAERAVVAVIVRASEERPHFAGPAYVRDGSKTVKASKAVYEDLIASRNTKAGAILRLKGQVVTVVFRRLWPAFYGGPPSIVPEPVECVIEGGSAFSVELRIHASGTLVSVALDRVTITTDPKNQRPLKLTVAPE